MSTRKLFLSYSRKDRNVADSMAEDLRKAGLQVWVDMQSIPTGARWDNAIEHGIDACDDLLVLLSESSAKSDVVLDEVNYALETKKRVLPILIDDCRVPLRLRRLESLRLGADYKQFLDRLLAEVTAVAKPEQHASLESTGSSKQRYIPAMAVLPFTVLGDSPKNQVMCDGLLTEIVKSLSANKDLFVISSATTRGYQNNAFDLPKIATELRVNYLVTGQITLVDDQWRVSCELSEAKAQRVLWGQTFDRNTTDFFTVQDEISSAIAHQLQRGISGHERKRIKSKPPASLTAWEMVVQAMYYGWSEQWLTESITLLRHAIELDPNLAEAHALLAARLAYMMWYGDYAKVMESVACADKAMALDSDNASVLVCSSVAYNSTGNPDKALSLVERAVELNPNLADGWAYNGLYLAVRGENDEALEMLDYALALSPKDPVRYLWNSHKVICYANEDKYEQALNACKESTRLNDQWFWSWMAQAQAQAMLGNVKAAQQDWSKAKALNPAVSISSFEQWLSASSLNETQRKKVVGAVKQAGCT